MVKTGESLLTIEEYVRLYGEQGPFEVIDGKRMPMTPQVTRGARIAGRLFRALADFVDAQHLGEIFMEAPFVLTADSNWVAGSRVPDVMFVRDERLAQLAESDPDWEAKPLMLVPDLVVEIVSPTDRLADVSKKIARYLQDGVRGVWLVEPDTRTVTIYRQGSKQLTRLGDEDTLSGEDVLPGFAMAVARLFD